jgi:glycosyltransferase involved in cell wall biosynthesis
MRILILHNRYKLHGGEDVVVQQESQLLRDAGHFVDVMEVSNDEIESSVDKLKTAFMSIYSPPMRRLVERRIQETGADVMHVHNFFPRLTPAVYDAGPEHNCAVVQTLHNYRLVCPGGLLFRDGAVCEECLGRSFALPGIQHGCYRGSRIGSATIATMTALHRIRGTWRTRVDRYIVLNEYARSVFTKYAGLPPERIRVKPNVVPDSDLGRGSGGYALFVGRLSPEKGVATLLRAASNPAFRLPLKIVGTGPMQPEVVAAAAAHPNIEYLGAQPRAEVIKLVGDALVQIVPSEWHEAGGPLVIGEAFAAGIPVVTPAMEPMSTVVQNQVNGLLYTPHDHEDLCHVVARVIDNPEMLASMRIKARQRYEAMYMPAANLTALEIVYREAVEEMHERRMATRD